MKCVIEELNAKAKDMITQLAAIAATELERCKNSEARNAELIAKCQEKSARIAELEAAFANPVSMPSQLSAMRKRAEAAEARIKELEHRDSPRLTETVKINGLTIEGWRDQSIEHERKLEAAEARVKELESKNGCQGCQDRCQAALDRLDVATRERNNFYGGMTRAEEAREELLGQLVKSQGELQKTKETLEIVVKDRDAAQDAAMSLSGCILAVRNAVHGRGGAAGAG